jgi:hypothetical protein
MSTKTTKRFDVISPDGFTIDLFDVYKSEEEAIEATKKWSKGYEKQGYYNSVRYGKIPLRELFHYCRLVDLTENKLKKDNIYYHSFINNIKDEGTRLSYLI